MCQIENMKKSQFFSQTLIDFFYRLLIHGT